MNIYKTFDVFNKEGLKLFAKRVLNIFMIQTENKKDKGIFIEQTNNAMQLNVVNNPKVYNLFVSATHRYNKKYGNKNRSIH